ncbi:Methyltransferase type 12 [Hyella patelloides LEGE 07179]|uniref:Methyltransferase type 12 n=1 Tax=Hyella patelloides LEGE 07179 TaxID=945734 RepID=A0A563VQB7_9CYAN|nr:class I SAM-dependent methyltransferase [Hyella patelloides]VEP13457.1 Methyltransferase type 12 [Hyella patelloides LEGE 07179]
MTTVQEHYAQVLADVYSWMFGGFEPAIRKNLEFFKQYNISPRESGVAIDLGAGCGFQSIPLAQIGFAVTAIDLEQKLLNELKENSGKSNIKTIQDDLINFDRYIDSKPELIVCMTDTILHLESKDRVNFLFQKVFSSLEDKGRFVITLRDLSHELSELERFITVKSDENMIFTCFLEYEPNTVKVHDIIYKKNGSSWKHKKSFYRKLRLSKQWVEKQLEDIGFSKIESSIDNGLITVVVTK